MSDKNEEFENEYEDEWDELELEIKEYLDCPCRCFETGSDAEIHAAYEEAAKRGKQEGFVPIIVGVDDTLWECLKFNVDEAGNGESYTKENVSAYRKQMLETPVENGKEILSQSIEQEKEWIEEYGMEEGEGSNAFSGYTYSDSVILAEIPVKNPWEVFAWLPFGGWNSCPDTLELMAVSKYWYEQHGAVPAVITHDVLEYKVPKPVAKEASIQLAAEQGVFCPNEDETLADSLTKSTKWFFWWD